MDLLHFSLTLVLFVLFNVCMMSKREEQRTNIKFLAQSGKNPTQVWRALREVYGDSALSDPQVRLWHKRFKDGRETTKDNPRSGRPSTRLDSVEDIRNAVQTDRRKTIQEVATEVRRPPSTVHKVMKKDLGMRKLCPKFVPHLLTDANKKMRLDLSTQNLDNVRRIPRYLDRIVSGDETWISLYNQETKFQSCQWVDKGGTRPQKIVKSRSTRKTMLTLFHDAYGVLLMEFLLNGETVDTDYYCQILSNLKERIRRKRPGLWERDQDGDRTFWLHQDNATPHTSAPSLALIGESGINLVPHPPYSPDLAPCDFAIFPYLKQQLRGMRFANIAEVQNRVRLVMRQTEPEMFYNAIRGMAFRWKKCKAAQGDYFEGFHYPISDISETEVSSEEDDSDT